MNDKLLLSELEERLPVLLRESERLHQMVLHMQSALGHIQEVLKFTNEEEAAFLEPLFSTLRGFHEEDGITPYREVYEKGLRVESEIRILKRKMGMEKDER